MADGDLFAGIAKKYDRINTVLSLGQDHAWRRRVIDMLPGGRVLDLGAGTGAANSALGSRLVVALDPSAGMLKLNPIPRRVVGVGEALPFSSESFDAVFSAFVFRNLASVPSTLQEVARVLKPGGAAGVVDLGRPRGRAARRLHRLGTAATLAAVGTAAGARDEYWYLHQSLDELPPPEEMFGRGPLHPVSVWRMGPLGFVYGAILTRD